jgi:hypothetical protein
MASAPNMQYTVRQVPPVVDKAPRRKAHEEGKSLNQTALEVLSAGLALSEGTLIHRDLDFLRSSWNLGGRLRL